MENNEIFDIGAELAEAAEKAPLQPRGLVEDLFPFIYEASRRISTRAISRWLESEHGIKLSAVTVAKALRNSERHWQDFGEEIQVAARIIEDASDVEMETFLLRPEVFQHIISGNLAADKAGSPEEYDHLTNEIWKAHEVLRKRWFPLNTLTQGQAAPYVFSRKEEEVEEAESAEKEGEA